MYGFHKVPHLQQGVLRNETETEVVNFENPNFKRGQPDLLCLIQRKRQLPNGPAEFLVDGEVESTDGKPPGFTKASAGAVVDINAVVNGIAAIKRHQSAISTELKTLQQSNQALWQEAIAARERHKKNEDTINRILKFLAGVFTNTAASPSDSPTPRRPAPVVPVKRARLMIEDGELPKSQIWSAEDLDLPASALDDNESVSSGKHLSMFPVESNHRAERFASVDAPQITEVQSPLTAQEPSTPFRADTAPLTPSIPDSTKSNTTPLPPLPSTANTSASGFFPSNLDATSLLQQDEPANIPQDPYLNDAIMQLLNNSDDLQRILENFPVLPMDEATGSLLSQGSSGSALIPRDDNGTRSPYMIANDLQKLGDGSSDISTRVNALGNNIDSIIQSIGFDPDDINFDLDYPSLDTGDPSAGLGSGGAEFEFSPYLENLNLLPTSPTSGMDSMATLEPVPEDPLFQEVTNTKGPSPPPIAASTGDALKKRKATSPHDFSTPQSPIKRKRK
jgi:hypothetical protein